MQICSTKYTADLLLKRHIKRLIKIAYACCKCLPATPKRRNNNSRSPRIARAMVSLASCMPRFKSLFQHSNSSNNSTALCSSCSTSAATTARCHDHDQHCTGHQHSVVAVPQQQQRDQQLCTAAEAAANEQNCNSSVNAHKGL